MIKCSISSSSDFTKDNCAEFVINELYRSILLADEDEFDEGLLKRYIPIFNEICKNWKFYSMTNYMHGLIKHLIDPSDKSAALLMQSAAIDISNKIQLEELKNDPSFIFYFAVTNQELDPQNSLNALQYLIKINHPLAKLEKVHRCLNQSVNDDELLNAYIDFATTNPTEWDTSNLIKKVSKSLKSGFAAMERLKPEINRYSDICALYTEISYNEMELSDTRDGLLTKAKVHHYQDFQCITQFAVLKKIELPNINYMTAIWPIWKYANLGEVFYYITLACYPENIDDIPQGMHPSREIAKTAPVYPFFNWLKDCVSYEEWEVACRYLIFLYKHRIDLQHPTVEEDIENLFEFFIDNCCIEFYTVVVASLHELYPKLVIDVLERIYVRKEKTQGLDRDTVALLEELVNSYQCQLNDHLTVIMNKYLDYPFDEEED